MAKIRCTIVIVGTSFSPGRFSRLNSTVLEEAEELGTIAHFGRYKGEPVPNGSAVIEVAKFPAGWDLFSLTLDRLEGCIDDLRRAGAEEFSLMLGVYGSDGETSLGFTNKDLRRMAELGVDAHITFYETTA